MAIQQVMLAAGGRPILDSATYNPIIRTARGAGMTGDADGKSGIFSGWIRCDDNQSGVRDAIILGNKTSTTTTVTRFSILRTINNSFQVTGLNSAGTLILNISSSNGSLPQSSTWKHLLASWDLAAGASHIYISDSSDQTVTTRTNDTINYAQAEWCTGADFNGLRDLVSTLAEVWFAENQFLDFSVTSNRRKFISAAGKPVFLGATGQLPLGATPNVYFHLADGETVNDWATNRGSGGNYTVINVSGGSLSTGSTSPSD